MVYRPAAGAAGPSEPLSAATTAVKVLFDGQEATPIAAYLEPGAAGIYRIEVVVPAGVQRRYPAVLVQGPVIASNQASAGGPSLLDVVPNAGSRGSDLTITVRGINLPEGAVFRVGGELIPGEPTEGFDG